MRLEEAGRPSLITIDANCVLSGFASTRGGPGRILRNVLIGPLRFVLSTDIYDEYMREATAPSVARLFERHAVSAQEYLRLLNDLNLLAEHVEPTGEPPFCRDEQDRIYLHCALTATVDALITRDRDLLDLGTIGSTPIVTPGTFLQQASALGITLLP